MNEPKKRQTVEEKFEAKIEQVGKDIEQSIQKYTGLFDGGRITWAFFVIFVGVTLLLNTTGIVSWGIWSWIWKFWPLLIVLIGLQIVIGKSKIANIIYAVIVFCIFASMITFTLINSGIPVFNRIGLFQVDDFMLSIMDDNMGELEKKTIVVSPSDLSEAPTSRNLTIELGASSSTLTDEVSEDYFAVDAEYYQNFGVPVVEHELENGQLQTKFYQQKSSNFFMGWRGKGPNYAFRLGQTDLPTTLDLSIGAGEMKGKLAAIKLSGINANVGAGNLELGFSEVSVPAKMKYEIGAAQTTIILPKNIGVSISYEIGVGEVRVDDKKVGGLAGKGTFESDNYGTAVNKTEIIVKVGAGKFSVERE